MIDLFSKEMIVTDQIDYQISEKGYKPEYLGKLVADKAAVMYFPIHGKSVHAVCYTVDDIISGEKTLALEIWSRIVDSRSDNAGKLNLPTLTKLKEMENGISEIIRDNERN